MSMKYFFSLRDSIGPVWPIILIVAVFMSATSLLCLFLLLGFSPERRRKEMSFLHTLEKAVEMFSTLAILAGMVGTCQGLIEVLPALNKQLIGGSGGVGAVAEIIKSLENVYYSTLAGLVIGGIWGAINEFLLHLLIRPLSNEDEYRNHIGFKVRLDQYMNRLRKHRPQKNSDHSSKAQPPSVEIATEQDLDC